MNALRGGFKRFDDRTDDNQKNRGKHHKSSRKIIARPDQSVLPILNFEDSNGISPVYSGASSGERWEAIDFAPKTTKTGNQNIVPINDSSFRTLRSIDNGKGDSQPRNIRKNLGRFGQNESTNQPSNNKPEKKHIHRKQHSVFDPFCMNDNLEEGQQDFANFASNSGYTWQAFSDENFREEEAEEDTDVFQGRNPFQRTMSESPSTNLPKFTPFGNLKNPYYEEEDTKENSFDHIKKFGQNFCENETEILETQDREVRRSENRQKQSHSSRCTRRSSRNLTRQTKDEQELLSCCDIETSSLSSFPERVKPIEFLKKERLADEQIQSSDEIFINFDEVSCHSEEADRSQADGTETGSDIGIETEIKAVDTGIEVIDVESVVSRESTVEKEGTQQADESKCNDSLEDVHSKRDELLSPMFGNNDYRTPREQSSPTKRLSTPLTASSKKLVDIKNTTMKEEVAETEDHSSTNTKYLDDKKKTERDQLNALQKFVKLAAPVLSSGAISLSKDDPIRLAAEKLGISLNDNTTEPAEYLVKVPLNVEIKPKKSQIGDTQKTTSKENSIHFKTNTKNRQREGSSMMSPSSSSLLDCDETDISDLHTFSQSVDDSSVDPRKHIQSIDLKSVHSGSISAITFGGGNGFIDTDGYSESRSTDSYKKVENYQRERRIPRGPTRCREYDMSTTMEKPDPPRVGLSFSEKDKIQKQKGKPLGASIEEIEMINKFLAIAGSNFGGSSLSIEERENLHIEALKAGLSEDFINKMLDQSAGILLWEKRSVSSDDYSEITRNPTPYISKARIETPCGSTFTGQSFRTKGSSDDITKATLETGYSEDLTYDEDRFTMKTPKEEKFSCFRSLFWMEASNVVGDDMSENMLAVVSADSESIYSRRRKSKR